MALLLVSVSAEAGPSVVFTLGVSREVGGTRDPLAVPGVDAPTSTSLAVQGRLALQPNRDNASVSKAALGSKGSE